MLSPKKMAAEMTAQNTSDNINIPTTAGEMYCVTLKISNMAGRKIKHEAINPTGKAFAMADRSGAGSPMIMTPINPTKTAKL